MRGDVRGTTKFDEDFKIGAVRIVRKTRPATGGLVSRRTCQGMHSPRRFRRCGHTASASSSHTQPQEWSRCPQSSTTSDDNPGIGRVARSRLHRRGDHRPDVITRTRHAEPTTFPGHR
jgi:hypothetical protein